MTVAIAAVTLLRVTHTPAQQSGSAATLSATSMVTALTVDGQAIPVREFMLHVSAHRAGTLGYFQQTYHAVDTADFWQTRFGDTTPGEYLIQLAVNDTVRVAVERGIAQKHGLLADPSYAGFLSAWTVENKRRSAAVAARQVIYGPTQYSESAYFMYLQGNLVFSLQQALASKGTISVTTADVKAYYLAHPEKFQRPVNAEQTGRNGPVELAPFEAIESEAQQLCLDEAFKAYITRAVERAVVQRHTNVLNLIPVR